MKTILTLLTGIVFSITILVTGGCTPPKEKNASDEAGTVVLPAADSTRVEVFLKDTVMGDTLMVKSMHLYMSDSRKPKCPVIDNLQTVVFPGDSVFFMKGKQSRVKTVDTIYQVDPKKVFNVVASRGKVYYVLEIDSLTPTDTIVKYVIEFTHKDSGDRIFIIDPYLRIPPGGGGR